jgi:hypothetical protein
VNLLVRRARGPQLELVDPIADEARVRVAIDEAGDRAAAPAVELLRLAAERG